MPKRPEIRETIEANTARMQAIGERLQLVRRAAGLTQQAISDLMGIDQSTWSKWEKGQRVPDVLTMIQFAARAKVTLDLIFRGNVEGIHPAMRTWLLAQAPQLLKVDPTDTGPDRDKALASYRIAIHQEFQIPSCQ
jgi:transcriptional regulator with XRE-family HTH domain